MRPRTNNPCGVVHHCLSAALLLGLSASCAGRVPPPVAFADTALFEEQRPRIAARLKADVDGDTVEEVIALQRVVVAGARHGRPEITGFRAVVYATKVQDDQWTWDDRCEAPIVKGSELDTAQWFNVGQRRLLLLVATESNPDVVEQSIMVLDLAADCAVEFAENLVITRPAPDMISPGSLRAGAYVDDEGVLRIVDQPKVLRLQGFRKEVEVLLQIRHRTMGIVADGSLGLSQGWAVFLKPVDLKVEWTGRRMPISPEPTGASITTHEPDAVSGSKTLNNAGRWVDMISAAVPQLQDSDDSTALTLQPGEAGRLHLRAENEVTLLEFRHGCEAGGAAPLVMLDSQGARFVTGAPLTESSFVRAAGRSHSRGWSTRELLALRVPASELVLDFDAHVAPRCISEMRAFSVVE